MVALRVLGALALLAVGAVHIEQYFDVHLKVVPVIGTMFALNFVGATIVGLLLLAPIERAAGRRPGRGGTLIALLVLLGIGIAAVSFVFLLVSENTTLFGFHEYGYRSAVIFALAAEGAAAVLLGCYLVARSAAASARR